MRARSDDSSHVPFIWHGTSGMTFLVSSRPKNIIRGGLIGLLSTFAWGAAWSVPVALVQPGPVGVLLTAAFAVVFGVLTGATAGVLLAKVDTRQRPLRHTLRTLRAELAAPRPEPEGEVAADTTHLWQAPLEVEAADYPRSIT